MRSLFITIGLFLSYSLSFAQDLVRKIPKDANMVVTFNNKVFFDYLSVDTLNAKLIKTKFFADIFPAKEGGSTPSITDFGIDLHSKAYLYVNGTDSVQYVGGLIPLANRKQFESFVTKNKRIEMVDNLPTIYSHDRTTRMSWDDHTLYILTGVSIGDFFKRHDVMERFGLLGYDNSDAWSSYGEVVVDTAEYADIVGDFVTDTVVTFSEEYDLDDYDDDYAIVDSILAQEEYGDDFYNQYNEMYRYNDSIKNQALGTWVNTEFGNILTGKSGSYDYKRLRALSKNTLLDVHIENIGALYGSLLPNKMLMQSVGMPWYMANKMGNENLSMASYYGVEAYDGQVDVVGNTLKSTGAFRLDKKIAKQYSAIYKRGVNPKFYNFLHKDILGFITLNINTEAYLTHLPGLIEQYYGPLVPNYADVVSLGATLFDVIVDEKAIGKVFKGDNLLVLNGVTNTEVTYKDYEYDEDYNAIEIERTKVEAVPQFMYMFSSEDTRVFDILVKMGVKESQLIAHDGFYEVNKTNNKSGIIIYIQIKNGVVYVGNDLETMVAIQSNTLRSKGHAPYIAIAKKNAAAFLLNPKRVPALLEELDIPVNRPLVPVVNDLKSYGDIYFTTPGVVGNTFKVESVIEFPKTKPNALLFLVDVLDRLSTGVK